MSRNRPPRPKLRHPHRPPPAKQMATLENREGLKKHTSLTFMKCTWSTRAKSLESDTGPLRLRPSRSRLKIRPVTRPNSWLSRNRTSGVRDLGLGLRAPEGVGREQAVSAREVGRHRTS